MKVSRQSLRGENRAAAANPETPAESASAPAPSALTALTMDEIVGDAAARTGLGGLEALDDVRLVVCPDAMVGYDDF